MNRFRSLSAVLMVPLLALGACQRSAAPAAANVPPPGTIAIHDATTRETPAIGDVGVGYLTIVNDSGRDDVLLDATSPAAGSIELHEMSVANGMMQMRALPNGLPVPAGQTVRLASGGAHLMLMDLKQPLVAGQKIPLTLRFRTAGELATELEVRPLLDDDSHAGH